MAITKDDTRLVYDDLGKTIAQIDATYRYIGELHGDDGATVGQRVALDKIGFHLSQATQQLDAASVIVRKIDEKIKG